MSSPILALRAAIRAACLSDSALAAAMGGTARLDDEPPRGILPVYAVFGDVTLRDVSTSSDRAHEQDLAIVVAAKPGSTASALAAAARFADLLDDAPLSLAGHRLVRLAVASVAVEREEDLSSRVTLTLQAATEVAA